MKQFNIYDRRSFSVGAIIIRCGDPATNAYLIQSGSAEVFKETDQGRISVGKLAPGDIIGDMAIIRGTKHLSTVITVEKMVAVIIPPDHLRKSIESAEPLVKTLLNGMIRKIDRMNLDA